MKSKRRVEFVIYGLHPALFCSEVDQYFICPICYFVASDPISCETCEQIYCAGCSEKYTKIKKNICHICKNSLATTPLRKFPKKVYESFFLYCPNYNNGCRFEGGIKEIHEHKLQCEYKKLNCLNPLCAHNFLAKDKTVDEAEVCSLQCLETYRLSEMLGKSDHMDLSKYFWKCLQDYRKNFVENIEKEYQELNNAGDEVRKNFETEIQELEAKFEEIKWHIHTGKYINDTWTCCQQTKEAIGCSILQQP